MKNTILGFMEEEINLSGDEFWRKHKEHIAVLDFLGRVIRPRMCCDCTFYDEEWNECCAFHGREGHVDSEELACGDLDEFQWKRERYYISPEVLNRYMPADINDPKEHDPREWARYKRWALRKGYVWNEQERVFEKVERS